MQNGIDRVLIDPGVESMKHAQLALVTNNAAKSAYGQLSRISLLKKGFNLIKLFSPEHGISSKGVDGAAQHDRVDDETGLPVISLYGNSIKPILSDLSNVDILLFDIPDIGCRFYTYLWTLTYVMAAFA